MVDYGRPKEYLMINYLLAGVGFMFKSLAKVTGWMFKGVGWYISSILTVIKKDKYDSKGKCSIKGEIL